MMRKKIGLGLTLVSLLLLTCCGKVSTWEEQYDLGVRYLSEGNYKEAIIAFTAAIEIDPKQIEAYIGRGGAYIGRGETDENLAAAMVDYEMAISLDATNAEAHLGLADVYIRQGDYDKALELLKEALKKIGEDQSITEKIAEMESGNITDSSGNMRRTNSYDASGALIWYHTYTYNQQGRATSVTSFDGQGNQTGHVDIRYDGVGNRITHYSQSLNSGKIKQVDADVEYGYNDQGKTIKEIRYDVNGEVDWYMVKQYDDGGELIRLDRYSADGTRKEYRIYEYDEDGREIKETIYSGYDGALCQYILTEYNEDGRKTSSSTYNAAGIEVERSVRRYDDDGNDIGIDRYDGKGNLIMSTVKES